MGLVLKKGGISMYNFTQGLDLMKVLNENVFRRVWNERYKCTEKGIYNTPVKFRHCAPKREL